MMIFPTGQRRPLRSEYLQQASRSKAVAAVCVLVAASAIGVVTGCASSERQSVAVRPAPSAAPAATAPQSTTTQQPPRETASARRPAAPNPHAAQLEEVERRYVVGPMAAGEIGYRVHWQYPDAGSNIKIFEVQDDSVFALDRRNFLTRIDREQGSRIWRVPVAEPIQEIIGLTYVPENGRVYLTAGGRLIVLDAATGSQVGTQRLEKIANTPPVRPDGSQFLIYGSRNGQLIWHSYPVEYQWRAYQISQSVQIKPVLDEDMVVTVGNDGRVTVHDINTASMLWDKRLLSSVTARPAVGRGLVYVAGLDQHLWAYDLSTGRSVWRYLADTPLTDSPVLVGDRVYQRIASEGLVCFEAAPLDSPGGRIHWKSPNVRGNVIAARNNRLLVWSIPEQTLTVADATRGGIMRQLHLEQANALIPGNIAGDELYAISRDGRIVRLVAAN